MSSFKEIFDASTTEFLIFSKPNCKYCRFALSLAKQKQLDYQYTNIIDYQDEEWFDNFYDDLKAHSQAKTFPIIYHNKKYIGGFTELQKLMEKSDTVLTDDF